MKIYNSFKFLSIENYENLFEKKTAENNQAIADFVKTVKLQETNIDVANKKIQELQHEIIELKQDIENKNQTLLKKTLE